MNLYHTGLSEPYREIETLGDPLTGMSDRIDFERIRLVLPGLYENGTEKGGRPNYDPVLMVKILLLQQWYNLSGPQIEREIRDRISFLNSWDILRNYLTGTPYGISAKDYRKRERIVSFSTR